MSPRIIADVYLRDGSNRRILTTPGRSVQFFGGHANVVDGRDMPHMFKLERALVQPRHEAMPWAPEWLRQTQEIKAEVTWPEGWTVQFKNPSEFLVYCDEEAREVFSSVPVTETGSVETVDMTAHPTGWINPSDLFQDPEDDDDGGQTGEDDSDVERSSEGGSGLEPDAGDGKRRRGQRSSGTDRA